MTRTQFFAENIRAIACHKGLKLGIVERAAGVAPGYISRLTHSGNISLAMCERLTQAVDADVIECLTTDYTQLYREDSIREQLSELEKQKEALLRQLKEIEG